MPRSSSIEDIVIERKPVPVKINLRNIVQLYPQKRYSNLVIDSVTHKLDRTEMQILVYLIENHNHIATYSEIIKNCLDGIKGNDKKRDENYVHVKISTMKRMLGIYGSWISVEKKTGYIFRMKTSGYPK